MKKKFCKLFFTVAIFISLFTGFNLTAHADPLSAAMLSNQLASGFAFTGLSGLSAGSVSTLTGSFYVDLVPWNALVTAAHAYCTIRDLVGSDNVEVELSPELSNAGYDRNVQFVQHYGANPGTIVDLGTFYRYGGYVFNRGVTMSGYQWYKGPAIGTQSTTIGDQGSFSVGGCTWSYVVNRTGSTGTSYTATIGAASPATSTKSTVATTLCLAYSPTLDNGRIGFVEYSTQSRFGTKTLAESGITMASPVQSTIQRPSDGEVVNPGNKANIITLPSSALDGISYTPGQVIDQEALVKAILDKITEAIASGTVLDSRYVDPSPTPTTPPTPVHGQTVSDTPWITFNTWFDNYFSGWTEVFGDIYDGIADFQESFGDWVEDVASGWTEVFGDIYDTLAGWTEVFGDIYDGIIDGFSDVAGTLEGIFDTISDIVQEIVSADANWVQGLVNNFFSQFQDWFDALKQHISIWHYVVEWLASIRSVFSFFFGVLSNTGYNYVLPIYACFAGTVVIAIYRRFGK